MEEIVEFINNAFGIKSETSAPILITLFVFVCSFLFQFILKRANDLSDRNKNRDFFKLLLEDFCKKVMKQAESYQKFHASIDFSNDQFIFNRATISSINTFEKLDQKVVFNSYFNGIENRFRCQKKMRLKSFMKIFDSIDSVKFWHEQSFQSVDKFLERYSQINQLRNDAISLHMQNMLQYVHPLHGKPIDTIPQYLKEVDNIHSAWQQLPNLKRADIIQEELISKLIALIQKNEKEPLTSELITPLLEASHQFDQLSGLLNSYRGQLNSYYHSFREFSLVAKKGFKIMSHFKFKFWT